MNREMLQSGITSGPAGVSGCFIWAQGAVSGDGPAAAFEPISGLRVFQRPVTGPLFYTWIAVSKKVTTKLRNGKNG